MFHEVLSSPRTNYVIGGALTIGAILGLSGYFGHSMPTFGTGIAVFAVGCLIGFLKYREHRINEKAKAEASRKPVVSFIPTPEKDRHGRLNFNPVVPYQAHIKDGVTYVDREPHGETVRTSTIDDCNRQSLTDKDNANL